MSVELVFLVCVMGLGIFSQWISWWFKFPAILLLLLVGIALGQYEYSPGVHFNSEEIIGRELLFSVVSLSVGVILFEGGLSLRLSEIRKVSTIVIRLVTIAILVTWGLTAAAVYWICDLNFEMSLILGALLVVSGPTVVIPLLRHIRPTRQLGAIIKWEGIVNDPIGAVLAVLVFEAVIISGFEKATMQTFMSIISALLIGVAGGALIALVVAQALKKYWIPDYLVNSVMLGVVLLAFVGSNALQDESGLITVTVLGICLANQKSLHLNHVVEFKENLTVLLISGLFILLASRVKLEQFAEFSWREGLFLFLLIFAIRPIAVYTSTIGCNIPWNERLFLAFLAPRGIVAAAVSSVFALHIAEEASHGVLAPEMAIEAERLVPLTFLVIVGTVGFYGLFSARIARWIKVSDPNPQGVIFAGVAPFVHHAAKMLKEAGFQVLVIDTSYETLRPLRMDGLNTVTASITSEYVRDNCDLGGIGRLLAMTRNNEVNALATLHFADIFGKSQVYQLPPTIASTERQEFAHELRGRYLFSNDADFNFLTQKKQEGFVVKKTQLTTEFTYEIFREMYPDAIVLFHIEGKKLHIIDAGSDRVPKTETTLISIVAPLDTSPEASSIMQRKVKGMVNGKEQ